MKPIKLTIKPYRNRHTGSTSWRVSGVIHGQRIRKNFKDRMHALDGKRALEITALQETSDMRTTATFLSESQLRQAEAVFLRLKDKLQPLAFYVDYALTNYKPASKKTLSAAKEDYCTQREADQKKNKLAKITLDMIKGQMKKLDEIFPGLLLADLNVERITQYCERGGAAPRTHNDRRDIVSKFLEFAIEKEWIEKSPIGKVPRYDIAGMRGSAAALTAEQAKKLMEYLETYEGGRLVPHYALCLFAGIRPDIYHGEISKLKPEDIHLENGVAHIEPGVSKVKMKRLVDIQPNLAAWLKAYPLEKYPIMLPHMAKYRAEIARQFNLSHDILRHTFISMHVAKFRSMGDTALQAGNSEGIIRRHYLNVKSTAEAETFFSICPKLKAVPEAAVKPKEEATAAAVATPESLTAAA